MTVEGRILRINDEDGVIDLNDEDGIQHGEGLDLGILPVKDRARFGSAGVDGEIVTKDRPNTVMTLPLVLWPPDDPTDPQPPVWSELMERYRRLTHALDRGQNEIEFKAATAEESVFFDTLRAEVDNLFGGQGSPEIDCKPVDDLNVRIERLPRARLARQEASNGEHTLEMAAGGRDLIVRNPDAALASPAYMKMKFAQGSADVVEVQTGRRSGLTEAQATEFCALYSGEFEDANLYTDPFQEVADPPSSGGAYVETFPPGDSPKLSEEFRHEIVPTDPDSMAGTYQFMAVLRLVEGSLYGLQLSWGARDVPNLDHTCELVELDARDADASPWVVVNLGQVRYEEDAERLVMSIMIQSSESESDAEIDFDHWFLMPTGQRIRASVPGWRGGAAGWQRLRGDELVANTYEDTCAILDALNETAQPNAALDYLEGKYITRVRGVARETSGARTKLGELRIKRGATTVASRDLYARKNRRESHVKRQITWESNGSDHTPQVIFTAAAAGGRELAVEAIETRAVYTLNDGEAIVLDELNREHYRDLAGVDVGNIHTTGLPTLLPGVTVLVCDARDWSGKAYQDDVDERGPLGKCVQGRTLRLTVEVDPAIPL